jgi:hypothetical protein
MRQIALTLLTLSVVVNAAALAAEGSFRKVRLSRVDVTGDLPEDLLAPEGKSRWHLESITAARSATRTARTIGSNPATVEIVESWEVPGGASASRVEYTDPTGGDAAIRWVFPHTFPELLRPGARATLRVEEKRQGRDARLWIDLEQVGIGWVHLPSGPREAVLQRARVLRETPQGAGLVEDGVIHRWVDPRAGVVVEVGGTDSGFGGATVVDEVLAGAQPTRIFVDELYFPPREQFNYAWIKQEVCVDGSDEGLACTQDSDCGGSRATCGTFVSSLTPEAYANIGDLVAASGWNFSPSVANCTPASADCKEIVQGNVALNMDETCNADPDAPEPGTGITCGYSGSGRLLGRQDADPGTPDWIFSNQVTERELEAGGEVIWLRAAAQKEAVIGGFGTGETRICYDPVAGKPEVALYRFPHQDVSSGDWYFQAGDQWSTAFACDQTLFSTGLTSDAVCGKLGAIGQQRAAGNATDSACGHDGIQSGEVVKEGVVTLPSGHTVNALLVRTVADFCVYNNCTCGEFLCGLVEQVRTVTLIWQVPQFGTVALFLSKQRADSVDDFDTTGNDTLAVADIRVGHFPPVSIETGTATETSVELSWDPGNHTHRIDNPDSYNVYWDTVSGASTGGNYANSTTVSSTSTTLSGLDPGTTYYFTVTSNSTYANPSNPGVSTTYESLRYPTTVSGDPSFVYPVEVQKPTQCGPAYVPASEVTGVTVEKSGGQTRICWDPVHLSEPCVEGYRVLGTASPDSDAGFSTIDDVGQDNCWTGSPSEEYLLVVTRGSGGTGPWGHYGR